jgi:uncharacterized Zn finger protein (UPF0148 family)
MKKRKLFSCPKCGEPILAHHVCSFCGYYDNREVIDVLAKEHEKEAKEEQKVKPLSLEQLSKK